jgi:hypothetical protein
MGEVIDAAVAEAVLAERERCARIADEHRDRRHVYGGNDMEAISYRDACEEIAAAIRRDGH